LIFKACGKWQKVPIITRVEPANISDGSLLKPLLEEARDRLNVLPEIVVADMGYVDQEIKKELRTTYGMAVVTRAKASMSVPSRCEADGCPCCPQGQRLIWQEYVKAENHHYYLAPEEGEICSLCPDQTRCDKEFAIPPEEHETFFGLIPLHTRLARQLLARIRPQVEAGFEADKNRLHLREFFINSLELARTLSYLADACNILLLTAELRSDHGRRYKMTDRQSRRQLLLDFGPSNAR